MDFAVTHSRIHPSLFTLRPYPSPFHSPPLPRPSFRASFQQKRPRPGSLPGAVDHQQHHGDLARQPGRLQPGSGEIARHAARHRLRRRQRAVHLRPLAVHETLRSPRRLYPGSAGRHPGCGRVYDRGCRPELLAVLPGDSRGRRLPCVRRLLPFRRSRRITGGFQEPRHLPGAGRRDDRRRAGPGEQQDHQGPAVHHLHGLLRGAHAVWVDRVGGHPPSAHSHAACRRTPGPRPAAARDRALNRYSSSPAWVR